MSESTSTSSSKHHIPWLDEILRSHGYNTFQLRDNVIDRFEQEQIDENSFFHLSEQDFIDLGVPLGPRKIFTHIVNGEKRTPKESYQPPTSPTKSFSPSSPSSPPLEEQTMTMSLPWLDELYEQHLGDKKGNNLREQKKSNEDACAAASASGEPTPEPPAAPADLTQTLIQNKITKRNVFTALTEEDLKQLQPTPPVGTRVALKYLLERATGRVFAISNSSNIDNFEKTGKMAANRLSSWGSVTANGEKTKNKLADSSYYSGFSNSKKSHDNDNDIDDDDDIDNNDDEKNDENDDGQAQQDVPASSSTTTVRDRDAKANENNHQSNNKSVFIGELKEEANKLFRAGDHSRALELYSRALSVDPQPHAETHAALLSNRSACYLLLQQPENALEDAEACLRLRPQWIKGHIRKIKALKELGRKKEAVKAVVEAHHHVGADPQLLELAREIPRIDDKIDETRSKLDSDTGNLIVRGDVDAIKARLSGDDARDVLLSVDGDGDNCLSIACYAHASASVLQLLVDRSEDLGILSEVLSSTDNKGHGCLLIGLVRNLHRQSLEVVFNALAKVGLLKNVLDVSKDPNPLLIVCSGNLNVNSFIGLLNAYSAHLPLTPDRAVVALGYAASNRSMTQNVFHVLLRETARLSTAAKQPLLFAARFNDGQTLLHILAKNNRADLLRIFIPFFESSDQFNVILTTPDQYGKLVTSNAYATSATVRDLLTPESFFGLRKKYKLIYGRTAEDTKDPLENTNIKIPWLQELFPGEPLDEPTVNLLIDNEIDKSTVFGLKERDIQHFPLRIRTTLLDYIRLKNPSNSKVKVDDFVNDQAQVNAANNNAASTAGDNNNISPDDGGASEAPVSDYKTEGHRFGDNESISAETNATSFANNSNFA